MPELTVLQQTEIVGNSIFLLPGLVLGVLGLVVVVCWPAEKFETKHGVDAVIIGILIFSAIMIAPKEQTGRYVYEILIDDNTDIQYIYNNYNVLERGYRVWTIEDKEQPKQNNKTITYEEPQQI